MPDQALEVTVETRLALACTSTLTFCLTVETWLMIPLGNSNSVCFLIARTTE